MLSTGALHTCALLDTGGVRCWGRGDRGQLGYASTEDLGDDDAPGLAMDIELGGRATQISAGDEHTCALMTTGGVRCWGYNGFGQLGYGHKRNIGDDETPLGSGEVSLGDTALQIAAGGLHTCALLQSGGVRCWGDNTAGQLGVGTTIDIGDDETPEGSKDVNLGVGEVQQLVAGQVHTCVLMTNGSVRCWGRGTRPVDGAVGGYGQLGYGNTNNIGDDEDPADAGDVPVGGLVDFIAAGPASTCAVMAGGATRCWGRGEGTTAFGQLGYPDKENIGDNEAPSEVGDIDLPGVVATQVSPSDLHSCVLDAQGGLRCWGFGGFGRLGYGNSDIIGDDEGPGSAGTIDVGAPVVEVQTGESHTCALTSAGRVVCWGLGNSGQLGYCNEANIGVVETPADIGPVPL